MDAMFDRTGRLVATSPRRRLRTAGVSTAGQVGDDRKLHELAEQIGRHWQFRYAINFQVIRDQDDRDLAHRTESPARRQRDILRDGRLRSVRRHDCPLEGRALAGAPRSLRVWRYWQEWTEADGS